MSYCRNCGTQMTDNADFCTKCGVSSGSGNKFCPNCGTETNEEQAVCLKCGVSLKNTGKTVFGNGNKRREKGGFVRVREGKLIGGVCTGISKCYGINLTATRIIALFIPFGILLYFVAMFTTEEVDR